LAEHEDIRLSVFFGPPHSAGRPPSSRTLAPSSKGSPIAAPQTSGGHAVAD
jgi:hypothetical protein